MDFVDGVVFGPGELVITVGRFVDDAPYTSDYTFERIYYRIVRDREEDFLATRDYLWRWDTDWFWCSKNLCAQNPLVRRLLGRKRLNSVIYTKVMRWNSRVGLTRWLDRVFAAASRVGDPGRRHPDRARAEFLDFFLREIGILPVWICPIRARRSRAVVDALSDCGRVRSTSTSASGTSCARVTPHPPGHFNRLIERKVDELGGIKSLYSESYYPRDEFWAIYDERPTTRSRRGTIRGAGSRTSTRSACCGAEPLRGRGRKENGALGPRKYSPSWILPVIIVPPGPCSIASPCRAATTRRKN